MIKVAILSFWHVHAHDYTKQAMEHPGTQVVALWDELPERGKKEATERELKWFDSLEQLLADNEIDAVIVNSPTNMHREVIIAAANANKHIFTEKVVATTINEVNEIIAAVNRNQVKLMVSLPRLNDGSTLAIQNFLRDDVLGEITLTRARLSHNGALAGWLPAHFFNLEQCGGGAMIDLGCHPMYLVRLFMGVPESVSAHYGYVSGKEVEDNAVAILKYPNGGLGIVEAGFVNEHSPFTLELHGTKGSLMYGTPENKLMIRSSLVAEFSQSWVEILELPSNRASAFEQWILHIQSGTTADDNIALASDLTRLMEAANLSVKLNRSVSLNELE